MPRYPWELLVKLGSHIEHGLYDDAHATLDRALSIIAARQPGRLPVRKLRCAQVASFCLRGAQRGGALSEIILDEHLETLEKLAHERNWKSVKQVMHEYVDQMIQRVQTEQHTNMQRLVARIRDDIQSSLDSPRTLKEYALAAGVSTGHLSRCFAQIAGCSFREERRRLRIEAASRMLADTSLKIGTVARRVGVRDASQFVAEFRKETGMTPGAFRLMHQG